MRKYLLGLLLIPCLFVFATTEAAIEQTLSMVKPDGVTAGHVGDVIQRYENAGLRVVALKMTKLNKKRAAHFYEIHKDKPFYEPLIEFMTSGPIVAMVLEGDNAIAKAREVMGATDFKKATPGTIRADFAKSIQENVVHGSDSPETAKAEIVFFFKPKQVYHRK